MKKYLPVVVISLLVALYSTLFVLIGSTIFKDFDFKSVLKNPSLLTNMQIIYLVSTGLVIIALSLSFIFYVFSNKKDEQTEFLKRMERVKLL